MNQIMCLLSHFLGKGEKQLKESQKNHMKNGKKGKDAIILWPLKFACLNSFISTLRNIRHFFFGKKFGFHISSFFGGLIEGLVVLGMRRPKGFQILLMCTTQVQQGTIVLSSASHACNPEFQR